MSTTDQEMLESIRVLALSILRGNLSREEKISIADLGDHCVVSLSVKVEKLGNLKSLSFDENNAQEFKSLL